MTSASLLEDKNFRPEVTTEVNGKYYGYLIGVVKERSRFRFQGPARAFTAKYGSPVTVDWPDATDFLYRDSRASAAALSGLLPDASPDVAENLRLYHFPLRVGYDAGGYRFDDTVLVVYLDPVSGIRSTFTIREESGRIAIYPLQVNGIPTQPSETSLVTVLGVATTDQIHVPVGPKFLKMNVRVQVPRHTFAAASYRNSWGRRDQSPTGSFGTSLDLSDRGDEVLRLIFEEAIRAGRTGDLVSSTRFRQAYELIASAHSRLPETIAKRSRAPNPGGIVR